MGGNTASQLDFSSYLSHSALLIKILELSEVVEDSQGTTEVSYVFRALCIETITIYNFTINLQYILYRSASILCIKFRLLIQSKNVYLTIPLL